MKHLRFTRFVVTLAASVLMAVPHRRAKPVSDPDDR
jgi:hypothetical protein